jgi:hypothetical protein
LFPNQVFARDMRDELAFALFRFVDEGQMRCIESLRSTVNERAERVFGDYSFQFLGSRFFKVGRIIHIVALDYLL